MKTQAPKRIVAFLLALMMALSLMPMVFAEETEQNDLPAANTQGLGDQAFQFEDVTDSNMYYYPHVYWAYNHDPRITAGTDATHFSPTQECTRGEIVTFLWAAAGKQPTSITQNPFKDVASDSFYYTAVLWAKEHNITSGTSDNTFSPERVCTRGEAMTFLWAAANKPISNAPNPYTEDVSAGDFYFDAVRWANANGITNGISQTAFGSNNTCKRCEIVTFLHLAYLLDHPEDPEDPGDDPSDAIGKALGDYPAADVCIKPTAFVDLIHTVQLWGAYDRTGTNTPNYAGDDQPAMLSVCSLMQASGTNYLSKGNIYMDDLYALYPDDPSVENWLYMIRMKGNDIYYWLECAASKIQLDSAGKPYVPAEDLKEYDIIGGDGFHYEIDMSKPAGSRVVNLTYNGETIKATQIFTVVVNTDRIIQGNSYMTYLNYNGCDFDPDDRLIYATDDDMINGMTDGTIRAFLVSYIKDQTTKNGGITPVVKSDWLVK